MFIKDKTKNIKVTSLILKIGIMTKLTMNSFVRIIRLGFKRYAYRHDKYGLNETLNYMNVMIVQNASETTMYELQFKTNKK